jgi:NTE family protein
MPPDPDPHSDWPCQTVRVLQVIDNQVRSLRRRQTIEGLKRGHREGVYLSIRSDIADYRLDDPLEAPHDSTLALAETPTRLARVEDRLQERLINWGYAICDAGLRRHLDERAPPPAGFPYPQVGVG